MKQTILFIVSLIIMIVFSLQPAFSEEDKDTPPDYKKFAIGTRLSSMNIGTTNLETGDLGDIDGQYSGTASYSLNVSYFFTPRYSLELSVDTLKARLNVKHKSEKGPLGELTQRPTLLTARLHFPINKLSGNFFLGIGGGHYYNDFENLNTDSSVTNDFFGQNMTMSVRESWGYHFVVGSEYFITEHLALNLDIKLVMKSTEAAFRPFGASSFQERDISMNASFLGFGLKYFF